MHVFLINFPKARSLNTNKYQNILYAIRIYQCGLDKPSTLTIYLALFGKLEEIWSKVLKKLVLIKTKKQEKLQKPIEFALDH